MNPFDQLLRKAAGEPIVPLTLGIRFPDPLAERPPANHGTGITAHLVALLSTRGRMTTRQLADAGGLEQTKLIWGLMKHRRLIGQVIYADGFWQVSNTSLQHNLNQAVQLLKKHGWRCIPPEDQIT